MKYLRITLTIIISLSILAFGLLLISPMEFSISDSKTTEKDTTAMALAKRLSSLADFRINYEGDRYRPIPPDEKIFTVSRNLRPVVDFWKRVYTGVYSFQAILHDTYNVTRVYAIVDLRDETAFKKGNGDGASISNAARQAHKRYKEHLEFLLGGKYRPSRLTGERKRLYFFMLSNGGLEKFKNAAKQLRVQRGLRDTFKSGLIRSGRYLEHYRTIFRNYGLPEELTLLPHLESSYQFNARSHAAAVGIWQLTKGASKRLINISNSVDERIDPWRSAEAAAKILKYNYNKLRTWPLAITAYNQGAYGMARAVRIVGTRDMDQIINKYKGRSYGFAGRNFYPAFVAVLEVVHHFEDYFGAIQLDEPLPFRQHKIDKSAHLKDIAKELGVDAETLADLNPHLRSMGMRSQSRIPKGTALNLPAESTAE